MAISTTAAQDLLQDSWRNWLTLPGATFDYQYDLQIGLPSYIIIHWRKISCRVVVLWKPLERRRLRKSDPVFQVDWEQTHDNLAKAAKDIHNKYNEVQNETTRTGRPTI